MKNKNNYLSIMITLTLIVSLYSYIGFSDSYFPYWDTYMNKYNVDNLQKFLVSDDANSYNPIFYLTLDSLIKITGLDYYYIAFYGNLLLILLLFLSLWIFLRNSITLEFDIRNKTFILLSSIILFFFAYYSKVRLSMLLRENLGFTVLFIFLALLIKIKKKEEFFLTDYAFILIFMLFSIFIHPLILLISSGIFLFSVLFEPKIGLKKKGGLLAILILFSLPVIYKIALGIFNQLHMGSEFVSSQGFNLAYNLININYFNNLQIFILIFGTTLLTRNYLKKKNLNLISISFIFVIFLGFFISYVERFGSKQNRFALYIYLIISLFSILLIYYYSNKYNKKFVIFLIFFIVLINVIGFSSYKGYRPISSENILFLEENSQIIKDSKNTACGRSALVATKYLFGDVCQDIIQTNNLNENKIIIFRDDLQFYEEYFPEKYKEVELILNSNRSLIKDNYGSIIIN